MSPNDANMLKRIHLQEPWHSKYVTQTEKMADENIIKDQKLGQQQNSKTKNNRNAKARSLAIEL